MIKLPQTFPRQLLLFIPMLLLVVLSGYVLSSRDTIAYAQLNGCGQIDVGNPGAKVTIPPECQTSRGGNADVVAYAKSQIGKIYGWGAPNRAWSSDPHPNLPAKSPAPSSFDCSGLTGWSWYWGSNRKVTLGGDTYTMWSATGKMFQRHIVMGDQNLKSGDLQNGDLLFWGSASGPHHVGIYVDEAHTKQAGDPPDSTPSCTKGNCFIDAPDFNKHVRWDQIRGFGTDFIGYIHVVQ